MFAKVTRPIAPDDTSDVVERDLGELGAALLVEVVDAIAAGTSREEPQDDSLATYAAKIAREDGAIDWSRPARRIHDLVRGLYPWPHAYTFLDGARIIVLKTRVDDGAPAGAGGAAPGTIVEVSREAIHVATGDAGGIAILELQPEGRRPMRVRDFLAGRPVHAGARMTGV
jgi:methionyl-tRNA formyltransferase